MATTGEVTAERERERSGKEMAQHLLREVFEKLLWVKMNLHYEEKAFVREKVNLCYYRNLVTSGFQGIRNNLKLAKLANVMAMCSFSDKKRFFCFVEVGV